MALLVFATSLAVGCGGGSAEEQIIELRKQQAAKFDEIVALYESDLPQAELQPRESKLLGEVQELRKRVSSIMPAEKSEKLKASARIVSDAKER